jgi:hypothetical protein
MPITIKAQGQRENVLVGCEEHPNHRDFHHQLQWLLHDRLAALHSSIDGLLYSGYM